eukprot:6491121-Amphidinium_carterae.1
MGRIYSGFLPKQSTCHIQRHSEGVPFFAFTDGTAKHPASTSLRRAGWAVVVFSEDGVKLATAHGRVGLLDSPLQTVFAGELLALVQVKRLFPEAQHIYCDNMAAVTGAAGGPNRDRVLRATDAELWQEFFRPSFAVVSQVHKVRAHQSKPEDGFEAFLWAGSEAADLAAKHSVGADIQGEE